MRVVVADDVMLTREGIVRLLKESGIEVVAEAEDADGLLRHVRLARPDAAIVDIRMPPTHTDEVLVAALRRLADGETVIDPSIVSRLVGRRRREDPLEALTEREQEVLGLVAEGLSNKAIAARLFVTERTVEAHVKQIFLGLRLDTNPESHRRVLAVLAYLRAGV